MSFLALLVLLQTSWVAAAGYCGHERLTPQQGAHFGHHAHAHEHAEPAGQADGQGKLMAEELQHGHCHLSQLALPVIDTPALAASGELGPCADQACRVDTFIPEGPDRPNWLRA